MSAPLFELADEEYLVATRAYPELPDIRLVIRRDAGMGGRSYGYFETPGPTLALSPRLLEADEDRVRAILRHELGHAVHETYGRRLLEEELGELPESDERLADFIAEHIWGEPILYDEEEVQSLAHGLAPRPEHLG